jgi:AcrR family transcriptional regulator
MRDDKFNEVVLMTFADAGVDRASLAEIASDAGIGFDQLTAKFTSADELFDSSVSAATGTLSADLLALADSDYQPVDRLLRMTRRLATPTKIEGAALFVVVRELLDGKARAVRAFRGSLEDAFDAFLRVIGESQFRGQLVPLPPRFLMSVILSGVVFPQVIGYGVAEGRLGGIHERDEGPGAPPRSALLAASIEALFNGILKGPIDLDPRAEVH